MWLNVKNLQLSRTVSSAYLKKRCDIKYEIENYNDKIKYKVKDGNCERIRIHLIISFEKYNI